MAINSVLSILSRTALTLGYLIVGFAIIYVSVCIYRAATDPLRDIPGPFLARFTRLWYLRSLNKGNHQLVEIKLHKKYGPIVRLAPNQFSFDDASASKTIYDHVANFPKSDFYIPFGSADPAFANVFQQIDSSKHATMRRKYASLYTMTSIVSYEPFVDSCMQTYMDRLDQLAKDSKPFDIADWMQFYAFDVIGAITVGTPYGFLTKGYDFPGIIKEMRGGQMYASHVGAFAGSWHKYIAAVTALLMEPPFLATERWAMKSIKEKEIALENGESLEETTGKQDFAEKLFALRARGKVNHYDLVGVVRANVAAGSDTTGTSLSATIYYLLRNPLALSKLQKEVADLKAKQDDPSKFITFAQAQEMPYLQAVIKEVLRVCPAVGMQLPRVVPKDGVTLAGRYFPAGTIVGVNAWVVHYNRDIFGEDADQFRPERWLEDEQKATEMERNLLHFGQGSRTCLGKNVALLEMQKLIPELVQRYEFELADKQKEWESNNRWFIYTQYDCLVRMRGEKGL